jgi:hypothetical protein
MTDERGIEMFEEKFARMMSKFPTHSAVLSIIEDGLVPVLCGPPGCGKTHWIKSLAGHQRYIEKSAMDKIYGDENFSGWQFAEISEFFSVVKSKEQQEKILQLAKNPINSGVTFIVTTNVKFNPKILRREFKYIPVGEWFND